MRRYKWLRVVTISGILLTVCTDRSIAQGPSRSSCPQSPWRLVVPPQPVQDGAAWRIDFCVEDQSGGVVIICPKDAYVEIKARVSNSRVPGHNVGVQNDCAFAFTGDVSCAMGDVLPATDEAERCQLVGKVRMWLDGQPFPTPAVQKPGTANAKPLEPSPPLYATSGEKIHVELRLEHKHFVYGDCDPLVGWYRLRLELAGSPVYEGRMEMQEQYCFHPKIVWPDPPEDRRDTEYYMSPPSSLHLEAHIPGNQYYRFAEQPVRYGTKMRLTFWYLIAPKTAGRCLVRIAQYKDTSAAWKALTEGDWEGELKKVGRWTKVVRVFRTQPEATTLSLDFRITTRADEASVGEMWIDDVTLEPVHPTCPSRNP